jgi:hypothetical protein
MKSNLLVIFFFTTIIVASAQAPSIQWQKCLGGFNEEETRSIQQTSDGGYIVAGHTESNDGDVTGNHGGGDYWIVKLNSTGTIEWQKCLGGTNQDWARSIQQTSDGGYIVAGFTGSNDGDVTGNHGGEDYWIVKLTSTGTIQWQKCLGGSNDEDTYSIQQTIDGGYIVAGITRSNDGDVNGNHGVADCWIVKLNSTGTIQWQKCLGGSSLDYAFSIQQTTDGGYIMAGSTISNDGDVMGNHGVNNDIWIVKLNSTGTIQWQKCLGGIGAELAYSVQQTTDGGYIVAGYTGSNDGDVSGNHGGGDYWIVKLNSTGTIQWQKCLGGIYDEQIFSIHQTSDGGYIVAGSTESNDGDVSGNHGEGDYWIVKLTSTGTIQWQKCLGGINYEQAFSIYQTSDGGYIVAGSTESNDGDVTGNHGGGDYWIVKLNNDNVGINEASTSTFSMYPNPANENITISLTKPANNVAIEVYDMYGKLVMLEVNKSGKQFELNTSTIASGSYCIKLTTGNTQTRAMFIKN